MSGKPSKKQIKETFDRLFIPNFDKVSPLEEVEYRKCPNCNRTMIWGKRVNDSIFYFCDSCWKWVFYHKGEKTLMEFWAHLEYPLFDK